MTTRTIELPRRAERAAPVRPAGRAPDSLWVRMVERWRSAPEESQSDYDARQW